MARPTQWGLLLVVVVFLSSPAWAQMLTDMPPPQHRVVHRNTFALRYNPLGLLYDARFSYRYRLYASDSVALRDNFVGVGVAPVASPAFVRIGPYVEVNPLTVFGVWAAYQYVQYFGTFDLLQSWPSARADFSEGALSARGDLPAGDPLRNYVTGGWELTLGTALQLKVGPVVVRNQTRVVRADMQLRAGDTVFYDQYYDVLAPNGGWYFTDDADVLGQFMDGKLIAGGRYTFTTAFYDPARHVAAGEAVPDHAMHRFGPLVGYNFKNVDGARFNNPTVLLLLQWWVKHRWRTGAASSQALPLVGLVFQFTGDFLPVK